MYATHVAQVAQVALQLLIEADGDLGGVTVAVADHLGDVHRRAHTTTPFPYVEIDARDLGELRVMAFHSLAPRRGDVAQWRSDVRGAAEWCAGPTPVAEHVAVLVPAHALQLR